MASISKEDYEAAKVLLGAAEDSLRQARERLGGQLKAPRTTAYRTDPTRAIRTNIEAALDAAGQARAGVAEALDA